MSWILALNVLPLNWSASWSSILLLRGGILLLRSGVLLLRSSILLLRSGVLLRRSGVLLLRGSILLLRSWSSNLSLLLLLLRGDLDNWHWSSLLRGWESLWELLDHSPWGSGVWFRVDDNGGDHRVGEGVSSVVEGAEVLNEDIFEIL